MADGPYMLVANFSRTDTRVFHFHTAGGLVSKAEAFLADHADALAAQGGNAAERLAAWVKAKGEVAAYADQEAMKLVEFAGFRLVLAYGRSR